MLIALRGALDMGPICTAEDWSSAKAGTGRCLWRRQPWCGQRSPAMPGSGIAAFSAIEPAPSTGCRFPASAHERVTPKTGILVHNLGNDQHGAFNLKPIVWVRVALFRLLPGLMA